MSARPRAIDVAALLGYGVAWLLPMAVVGWLGGPPQAWPTQLRDLYAVSCLFGRVSDHVSVFYLQARYADRPGWHDLPEHDHFQLEPFGHRTRFDRFMTRFGHQDSEAAVFARTELAHWVAAREQTLHPERSTIVAIRFVWADREISEANPPDGRWRKPPRERAGRIHQLGDPVVITPEQEPR